ncbi:MAG: creatininase family protein [Pseudanabaenaceae cyanobacterium bins.68]|nr:creatininase family protein [Pseudanabaenaceae cyanobacterium bins.68]
MLLSLSTWPEIQAYLQRSQAMIIPIGSTEQHGPTGLIGTDFICAEAIAHGVGAETGTLVGSTICLGMAEHHLGFPGTISLQPSTLIALVQDYVHSLAQHGFDRFFFINGHGGNIAVLRTAFSQIYRQSPHLRCRVGNWWMSSEIYALVKEWYGSAEGHHATPSEISVTQFLYPAAIKTADLSQPVTSDHQIYSPQDFRQRYPDGRMGSNPALANPEHGKQLCAAAIKNLSQQCLEFFQSER